MPETRPPESAHPTPVDSAAPTATALPAADASLRAATGAPPPRLAIYVVSGGLAPLPDDYDDPSGAWTQLLASATLGDVLVSDDDVETVATNPLTLVLSTAAGRRLGAGSRANLPFVVTLDGARLYAGQVMFAGTARALRHPLIHRVDRGISVNLVIVPSVGATKDTSRNAPAVLLEHFERGDKLLAAGAPATPRTRRRRLVAEVARADVPGTPVVQVEARCDDAAGTSALIWWSRRPGSRAGVWDADRAVSVSVADFDALWAIAMATELFVTSPSALAGARGNPPSARFHFAIEAERRDGTVVQNDQAWNTPSTVDSRLAPFFTAATELARRTSPPVPPR